MRWSVVVGGVAILVASACVQPPPPPPPVPCTAPPVANTSKIAVSYVAPVSLPGFPGPFTNIHGTITNTGPCRAHYLLRVVASSGDEHRWTAYNVRPAETAVWISRFVGDVTVADVQVTAETGDYLGPVAAAAAITLVEPTQRSDIGAATEVKGTLTNTGTSPASFSVELQANNGQVSLAGVNDLAGGTSATWTAIFYGTVTTARILRVTPAVFIF